jgi:serine/threonine-protein kinase RsbW
MAGEHRVSGLAVPETLNLLHDLLESVATQHPEVSVEDLMLFETAVIEIAGNVVRHARPQGQVLYEFCLRVQPDRLAATLSDAGEAAFAGASMPVETEPTGDDEDDAALAELPESGRGLDLARAALDELRYTREDGRNVWHMMRLRR